MSLVDYASSSDEDEPQPPIVVEKQAHEPVKGKAPEERHRFGVPAAVVSPNNDPPHSRNMNLARPLNKQKEMVSAKSSELKLPDASFLLNSPAVPSDLLNTSDHSSRVAAAMAGSAARKRDLKGPSSSYPRSKVPKGNLCNLKNVPDTVDGRLLPPQLIGRSNVVTEDISKLFVKKHANLSTE